MDLTPTEMTDTNEAAEQQPEVANTHDHEHAHDHEHTHQHAPTLNPELTREIEVEVGADEVSKSFKTVVKRYQKLARIPGFRAGKVPESLIRSKFAKEVRQEVLESLVSERFRKAIQERKLRPISEPQLLDMQLADGQPLRTCAQLALLAISAREIARLKRRVCRCWQIRPRSLTEWSEPSYVTARSRVPSGANISSWKRPRRL